MCPQIYFLLVEAEFFSEAISVNIDNTRRDSQNISDLFTGFAVFDQMCKLDLGGAQVAKTAR